jgi:hypothetical protein
VVDRAGACNQTPIVRSQSRSRRECRGLRRRKASSAVEGEPVAWVGRERMTAGVNHRMELERSGKTKRKKEVNNNNCKLKLGDDDWTLSALPFSAFLVIPERRGKSGDSSSLTTTMARSSPFPPPTSIPTSPPTAKMFRTAPRMAGYVSLDLCSLKSQRRRARAAPIPGVPRNS